MYNKLYKQKYNEANNVFQYNDINNIIKNFLL